MRFPGATQRNKADKMNQGNSSSSRRIQVPEVRLRLASLRSPYLLWGLIVFALVSALEVIVHINHPVPYYADDTPSYIYAAEGILYHGRFVGFYRGPAYPTVMALTAIFTGASSDKALYIINQVLYIVATLEIFAFIGIATRRPAVAGIVALIAGLYFYPLSYDNLLLGDSFCAFMIPTLILSVVIFLSRPRPLTLWLVALTSAILSLSLSEWFFFPIILFAYLAWMVQRRGLLRSFWPHLLGALGGLLALIGVYIEANGRLNGYRGISFIQNPDLLGKVLQYHMTGASPEYAWLDQMVAQYQTSPTGLDPFHFGYLHPDVSRDFWALGGDYARSVILHHPLQYLGDTLNLVLNTGVSWPVELVSPTGRFSRALSTWEAIGHSAYQILALAVLFALAWFVLLFVRSTSHHLLTEVMGAIALLVAFDRTITVAVVYSEYERLQAPTAQMATVLTFGSIVLAFALFADLRASKRITGTAAEPGRTAAMGEHADGVDGKESRTLVPSWQPVRYGAATTGVADSGQDRDRLDIALLPTDAHMATPAPSAFPAADLSSAVAATLPATMTMPYAPFPEQPEISIVLPCLNEEEAIGGCIDTLQRIIARHHLSAEIVVVDNASTDRSAQIAAAHGARVVEQPVRGYGNAYLKGFAEAHGTYIVMADADNTYDLGEVDDFVQPLREGYDLVMGNRFAGRMAKGAMTFSHR